MRAFRFILSLSLILSLIPSLARAGGYASAQAQAGLGYATPQAALAPAYGTCGAGAALAVPQAAYAVPQQQVIVQRQVIPQAVYVQPQAAVIQRQAYAPVVQQQIVSPYVPQAQALANVGYGGVGANLAPANGLVLGRQRAQKTVSRSRAVTVTRRPGLVNRVLGR